MLIRTGMGGQLSGSVGGVVASHNKGGQYLRNRSVPTNPNSTGQQRARNYFGGAAIAWAALSAANRAGWEAYAAGTPVLNRLGESITLSGFNWYVAANAFIQQTGGGAISAAPSTPGLTTLGTITGATLSEASGIAFATAGATATGGGCIASVGPPVSAGVSSFAGPYSAFLTGATFTATGFAATVPDVSPLRYGSLNAGEIRGVRVAAIDGSGKLSNVYQELITVGA